MMHPNFDPVIFLNFILTLAIFIIALIEYLRRKIELALYLCIAFGLFCITHLLAILGLDTLLSPVIIIIRPIAYLLIIFVLYRLWVQKKSS